MLFDLYNASWISYILRLVAKDDEWLRVFFEKKIKIEYNYKKDDNRSIFLDFFYTYHYFVMNIFLRGN